jgi:type I restriction enzyme R subunit
MSFFNSIGQIERLSQNRLSNCSKGVGYDYYNWEERDKNSNIEESYLGKYLLKQGYSPTVYGKAIYELKQVLDSFSDDLYLKNKGLCDASLRRKS